MPYRIAQRYSDFNPLIERMIPYIKVNLDRLGLSQDTFSEITQTDIN